MTENRQPFEGTTPPGGWVTAPVQLPKEPSNGARLKARDWIAIIGIFIAGVSGLGAWVTSSFWSSAEGSAMDARFTSHVETQKEQIGDIKDSFREVRDELKSINKKLDKRRDDR